MKLEFRYFFCATGVKEFSLCTTRAEEKFKASCIAGTKLSSNTPYRSHVWRSRDEEAAAKWTEGKREKKKAVWDSI